MDPLKIAIVDDKVEYAEKLRKELRRSTGILDKFKINYQIWDSSYESLDARDFVRTKPDVLLLNENVSNRCGFEICREIKKMSPFTSVILTSGTPAFRSYRQLRDALNQDDVPLDGIIDEGLTVTKKQRVLRSNLRKPLNLAVLGLGYLGVGFMQNFLEMPEVAKVNGFSEREKTPGEGIVDYDSVYKLLEVLDQGYGQNDKLNLLNSLEEAVSNTDAVVIATSAIHGSSLGKVAKTPHRMDLIDVEGDKISRYCQLLHDVGYNGLVTIFTNPVGGNLTLGRKVGLECGQLTSSINIDEERLHTAAKAVLGNNFDGFFKKFYQIVGDHGDAHLAQLHGGYDDIQRFTADYRRVKDAINDVLLQARQMAPDSMKASSDTGMPYYKSQLHGSKMFAKLARFGFNGIDSAYCYANIGDQKGYLALPVKVDYYPEIRFYPDSEVINDLDGSTIQGLEDRLKFQGLYVENFLRHREKNERKNHASV
ncbi:response regulator [Candidatus Pacearchaeota archaeon]|nr:response regulator [Candidatus Pacearchaeota archaeon]